MMLSARPPSQKTILVDPLIGSMNQWVNWNSSQIGDIRRSMRKLFLVLALLLACISAFGQDANNQALGGKVNEGKTTPPSKKSVPKPVSNQDKPLYSPCGVYYKNRRDMIGESNLANNWFSLGE